MSKLHLLLFMLLFVFLPCVSAYEVDFDKNIYVKPFLFGTIKEDDGANMVINDENFIEHKYISTNPASNIILNKKIYKNNLFIFYFPSNQNITFNRNYLGDYHKFFIKINTQNYPDLNTSFLIGVN